MSRKPQFDIALPKTSFCKGLDDSMGFNIQGSLCFTPVSNMKVKKFHLKFEGRHIASTATDFRRSEEVFFQHEWSFLSSERGKVFEAGKQVRQDFTLTLPGNLPETVKADYGSIQYRFSAYADTSITSANLKAERPISLRRHTSALIDERYITEVTDVWKEAVSYYLCIPSFEVAPGDEFPLKFHHRVLKDSIRVLLIACILKEHVTYASPRNPDVIVREHDKSLDTTFTWCQEDHMGEGKGTINVKIPSTIKAFDSRNKRIIITHRLHVRIDIDWKGQLVSDQIDLPIIVVPQVEGIAEELPDYNALPSPPSYEEFVPPTSSFEPTHHYSIMI